MPQFWLRLLRGVSEGALRQGRREGAKAAFREPSDAEVEAAAWAHTPIVFIDTTGWDERSATYQATLKADALKHMRAALIAAAGVRRNEGRRH